MWPIICPIMTRSTSATNERHPALMESIQRKAIDLSRSIALESDHNRRTSQIECVGQQRPEFIEGNIAWASNSICPHQVAHPKFTVFQGEAICNSQLITPVLPA